MSHKHLSSVSPMRAISVRQPWAWLLIHGTKDVENREFATPYRGQLAIHAGAAMAREGWEGVRSFVAGFDPVLADCIPPPCELIRGAVIGTMVLRDCVLRDKSPWFRGPVGWMLSNPESCDPVPAKGRLGLWTWQPLPYCEECGCSLTGCACG